MSKLEFHRVYYKRYDTIRINIRNGILVLKENCEVLKIDETEYGYKKAVVQLHQSDLYDLMKNWEEQINKYLKGEGIPPITILYGNKIYPKTEIHNPTEASTIKIDSVWINAEKKPFLQLWLK